jgi:hypothetical protein
MNEAQKQLETLVAQGATSVPRFAPNSRYYTIATATLVTPDGRMIPYLKRRFVPPPERLATVSEHGVVSGDRIDLLAATYIGDPELYWQLCDANGAMRPDELTETVGRWLRISLPEGIPGAVNG